MLICSNCGKKLAPGLEKCPSCGAAAIQFDVDDDPLSRVLRKPWVQAAAVAFVVLMAFLLFRNVLGRKAPLAAKTTPSIATPVPKTSPSPKPAVILPGMGASPSPSSAAGDGGDIPPMLLPELPFVGPDPGSLGASPSPGSSPSIEPDDQSQDAAMPADVRNWLDHLASIEQERQALATQELGAVEGLAGNSSSQADGGAANYANAGTLIRAQWADLSQRFNAEAPPPECGSIRTMYNSTLTGTRALMTDLLTALRNAANSPERAMVTLTRIRNAANERVDQPAEMTDEAVEQLCSDFNVDKWFDIDNRVADKLLSSLGM